MQTAESGPDLISTAGIAMLLMTASGIWGIPADMERPSAMSK